MTGAFAIAVALGSGLFGILIGSFLNVVIYRVPAGISLIAPPSACPDCGNRIRPWDNVPVVSWLALRAKCRDCGQKISARYPLVEAGTGFAFAAVALVALAMAPRLAQGQEAIAGSVVLVAYLYLAAITVALGLIDLDVHKLPNRIVLPAYLVAGVLFLAASVLSGEYSALVRAGIGMAALFVLYFVMAVTYPGGMGLGDVKLAGVLGIFLGWTGWGALVVGAFSAFLLGGLYAIALILFKRANRKSGIPFGPWMLAGAWIGIGLGGDIFSAYLNIFGLAAV